jgi:hypothetical protein
MTKIKKAQDGIMQRGGILKAKAREKAIKLQEEIRRRNASPLQIEKVNIPGLPPSQKEKDYQEMRRRSMGNKAKDGKWIQKAIKKPGALRKQLGAKPGKPIPASKLTAAAKKPGKLGQRARLAKTLSKMRKKQ